MITSKQKDRNIYMKYYFLNETHKEAITFQGDAMGHIHYTLPKIQWLLWKGMDFIANSCLFVTKRSVPVPQSFYGSSDIKLPL